MAPSERDRLVEEADRQFERYVRARRRRQWIEWIVTIGVVAGGGALGWFVLGRL